VPRKQAAEDYAPLSSGQEAHWEVRFLTRVTNKKAVNNYIQNYDLKTVRNSFADPHRFYTDADPDPVCHLDSDPDPDCHFNADPDPTFHFHAGPNPDPDLSFQLKDQNLQKVLK
jgi:hypothetical protein